jgi:hypothetical protein
MAPHAPFVARATLAALVLSLSLGGCGSFYGSVGPMIGYSPGRGACLGLEVGNGLFTDKWQPHLGEGPAPKLVRASVGILSRPAGGGRPSERVLHLTWEPRLFPFTPRALESVPDIPGATLGAAYTLGGGYSPVAGLSMSSLDPVAGDFEYINGNHFPGPGHVHWFGITFGWRYLAGGSLFYVQPTYMLSRSGTWRGID